MKVRNEWIKRVKREVEEEGEEEEEEEEGKGKREEIEGGRGGPSKM